MHSIGLHFTSSSSPCLQGDTHLENMEKPGNSKVVVENEFTWTLKTYVKCTFSIVWDNKPALLKKSPKNWGGAQPVPEIAFLLGRGQPPKPNLCEAMTDQHSVKQYIDESLPA